MYTSKTPHKSPKTKQNKNVYCKIFYFYSCFSVPKVYRSKIGSQAPYKPLDPWVNLNVRRQNSRLPFQFSSSGKVSGNVWVKVHPVLVATPWVHWPWDGVSFFPKLSRDVLRLSPCPRRGDPLGTTTGRGQMCRRVPYRPRDTRRSIGPSVVGLL